MIFGALLALSKELKKWIGWQTDMYLSTVIATIHRALKLKGREDFKEQT